MARWQADFTLGVIALIWGATFVMVKNALSTVGPITFIALRFIIASVVLLVLFRRRLPGLTRAEMGAGAFIGLWLGLGYVTQTVGLQYTTSGKAGFITGLNVVIVPILATLFLRQPPGRGALAGVAAATVGLGFLSLDEKMQVGEGDLWVMACAVCYAAHIVAVSHFAARHDAVRLAIAQIAAVAALTTVGAFVFETPRLDLPAVTWGALGFTGAVATSFVFTLQVYVQRFTTPTRTALLFSLEPVFAALFGWWWAGEVLGPKELLGCGLILAGMVMAELGGEREAAHAPAPHDLEARRELTPDR